MFKNRGGAGEVDAVSKSTAKLREKKKKLCQ